MSSPIIDENKRFEVASLMYLTWQRLFGTVVILAFISVMSYDRYVMAFAGVSAKTFAVRLGAYAVMLHLASGFTDFLSVLFGWH